MRDTTYSNWIHERGVRWDPERYDSDNPDISKSAGVPQEWWQSKGYVDLVSGL